MNLHFFILHFLENYKFTLAYTVSFLSTFLLANVHFLSCLIPAMSPSMEIRRKLILSNLFLT